MLDKGEKKSFDEVKSKMEEEMLQAKLKDTAFLHQTMVDLLKAADVKISDESLKNALKTFLDAGDSTTSSK
jgi:foldase protein prsA